MVWRRPTSRRAHPAPPAPALEPATARVGGTSRNTAVHRPGTGRDLPARGPPGACRHRTHPPLRNDRSARGSGCRMGGRRHPARHGAGPAQPAPEMCRRLLRPRRPRHPRAHPGTQPRRRPATPHRPDDLARWEPHRRQHPHGHRPDSPARRAGRRRRRAAPGPAARRPGSSSPRHSRPPAHGHHPSPLACATLWPCSVAANHSGSQCRAGCPARLSIRGETDPAASAPGGIVTSTFAAAGTHPTANNRPGSVTRAVPPCDVRGQPRGLRSMLDGQS